MGLYGNPIVRLSKTPRQRSRRDRSKSRERTIGRHAGDPLADLPRAIEALHISPGARESWFGESSSTFSKKPPSKPAQSYNGEQHPPALGSSQTFERRASPQSPQAEEVDLPSRSILSEPEDLVPSQVGNQIDAFSVPSFFPRGVDGKPMKRKHISESVESLMSAKFNEDDYWHVDGNGILTTEYFASEEPSVSFTSMFWGLVCGLAWAVCLIVVVLVALSLWLSYA
mmetsp:Transcript_17057/g.31362  ORF Transcript_17057/g.31362 Transcript_17057/m.31362 type:complete len:227 (+) Transcript_17057:160-840(+)